MIGDVPFQPGDPAILGGSFAVWNDIAGNGITEKDVNDRVFPAMQVMAQKTWAGRDTAIRFDQFNALGKKLGEGPAINIRGKIGKAGEPFAAYFNFDKADKRIVVSHAGYARGYKSNALLFKDDRDFIQLPYQEIGFDYTVSFWLNPAAKNRDNAFLFSSPNAVVKLTQGTTGKLGFSREGYDFNFDYAVPKGTWTHIVITGTSKGTSLYVNGRLQKKLSDNWIQFTGNEKTKMRKVETLFFPLQKIGGFKGKLDELKIWSRVLSDQEINQVN